jgi:hypothetical protein
VAVVVERQRPALVPVLLAPSQVQHWGSEPQQNSERRQHRVSQPVAEPPEPHCYLDLHSAQAHRPEREPA